jgi:hypothetical protein
VFLPLFRIRKISLEEYLERIAALFPALPMNGERRAYEGPMPYELVEDLIGSVDSSLPEDPDSPPHRPPVYYLIAEKPRKQGLNAP